MSSTTPLAALGRGLLAGAVGTAVMTGIQEAVARVQARASEPGSRGTGDDDGAARGPADPWEEAPAPAKVGRRLIVGVLGREVSPERIGLLTNAMHWGYGTAWGGAFGLMRGSGLLRGPAGALGFGALVWAMSYVELVPMGLYRPPTEYPLGTLATEAGYHLAYGAGVGTGWKVLGR